MKKAIKAKPASPGRKSVPSPAAQSKTANPKKDPPKKKPVAAASGLAFREFKALRRQLDLSLEELTTRLGLSPATAGRTQGGGPPHDR